MLSTLAALQLVLLTQVGPPPKEVTPDEAPGQQAAPPASAENPPLPSKPGAKPAAAAAARPRQLSLLSAETLGGASASLAWAGWKSVGIAYAQGITDQDDLGAFTDLDWSTAEWRLGGWYRRGLGKAGVFDMAGTLSAAWYQNFGATWVHSANHTDRGIEFVPGLALSNRMAGGVFSMLAEAPITITWKYGSGLLFSPRFSLAYEAPLYPELTLGARVGLGYRAGSGDAPLKEGQADFTFLLVATYQLL